MNFVDRAANQVARAPTQAQSSAGNYKKGHLQFQGLDISIETPRGAVRRGTDAAGKAWRCTMPSHYGYIRGSTGADDEQIDVYVGPHPKSPHIFVVDQLDADSGQFDEHKVMLGFGNKNQARTFYKKGFSDGRGGDRIAHIAEMTMQEFKDWLRDGETNRPIQNGYAGGGVVGRQHKAAGGAVEPDEWFTPGGATGVSTTSDAPDEWFVPGAEKPKKGALADVAMQLPTGFNNILATGAGAPVDLVTGGLNLGIRGVNKLAGSALPEISNPFGGSESIKRGMGHLGIDPDNAPAETTAGQYARAAGEGAGMMLAPEAAVAGVAKTGALAPRALEIARGVFGHSTTAPALAANAGIGAAGGVAGKGAEDLAPEPYKPLANMAGNLVGVGLTAVGAAAVPSAAKMSKDAMAGYWRPLSKAGREQIAADTLAERSSSPMALRDSLENLPPETVPGSAPTTFQATGDMGLGALEREVATRNPAEFMQRRAEQNTARTDALRSIEESGSPADVANAVRRQFHDLDNLTGSAVERATAEGAARSDAIGGHGTPESIGASMREDAASARAAAKMRERALWKAVDPDNSLVLPVAGIKQTGSRAYSGLPYTARPIAGEEAAIRDVVRALPLAAKFSEVSALRSRVSAAMREELLANGQSPSYARLTQLRGAIEDALHNGIEKTAAKEARAVASGTLDPAETIGARLSETGSQGAAAAAARQLATGAGPKVGGSVFTPSGRQIGVEYQVVPASDLVTSHTPDMQPNPSYPAELQPRDRSRAASDVQVSQIAKNLQPERLGASVSAGEGAPIVGPGGVVESGNARTLAIRRALAENGEPGRAYRQFLEAQGYDTQGIKDPVLVRRRTSDLAPDERVRFTEESNASPTLSMSASERAVGDAQRLSDNALDLYKHGDISSPDNRDFVRSFLKTIPQRGEEAAMVTGDGRLSLDGERRIQNALLHAGYGDGQLVARLAESGDESIKALGGALSDVAGEFAKLRRDIGAGRVAPGVDISRDILEAVSLVDMARAKKTPLHVVASWQDAFNPMSAVTEFLLRDAYGARLTDRLSRERFASYLRDYAAEARQQTTDARLFGEPANAMEILQAVRRSEGNGGSRSGHGPWDSGKGDGAAGAGGRRPDAATPEPGGQGASGSDAGRVLERPELVPNFDEAAYRRLAQANMATRDRVQTFDKGAVGGILRTAGMASQYRMMDSAVPTALFKRGPTGFETVQALRKAVGDARAVSALGEAAAASLRQAAMRPDGIIDPARFSTWRKGHAEALRGLPEITRRFDTAANAAKEIENVALIRREALDQYQRGALGRVLGANTPDDVTQIVGTVLQQRDAPRVMRQLVAEVRGDPAAMQGLRKSVVDFMANKFISNTEAATTGEGLLRSDQFQSFIRNATPALKHVLGEPEMNSLRAIANDLQRANRSITAVKLPGGSNTAQDQAALNANLMNRVIHHGTRAAAGAVSGFAAAGFLGSLAGAVGSAVVGSMREAGMRSVNDLVRDAMLNPELARILLSKAGTKAVQEKRLAQYLRRVTATALFNAGSNAND